MNLHWISKIFATFAFFCALIAAFAVNRATSGLQPPNVALPSKEVRDALERRTEKARKWQTVAVSASIAAAFWSALASFF
jgi:hypothetical protein